MLNLLSSRMKNNDDDDADAAAKEGSIRRRATTTREDDNDVDVIIVMAAFRAVMRGRLLVVYKLGGNFSTNLLFIFFSSALVQLPSIRSLL